MTKKPKHLCDWKKNKIIDELDSYRELVANPKYVCQDCGRAAVKKKWLCKPIPLYKE
jgi:hypothetical protein